MSKSKIEWTETTWNPVTGCSKISEGCKNCYAERMSARLKAMHSKNYQNGFEVTCHPHALDTPLSWKTPRMVFVNSMSDIFHDSVPDSFVKEIFNTMKLSTHHTYQLLTKRPERLAEIDKIIKWQDHIWMGVTVESGQYKDRIDYLRACKAKKKFLSIEPLIDQVGVVDLDGIDWVIVGGESGPGSRIMKEEWIVAVRDQCIESKTPFFFKQWGGVNKKKTGRLLKGKLWDEYPAGMKV